MSEWKEEPLENVTLFIKDGSHGSHKDCANGIPLLSAKDIVDGKVIIPDDCRRISLKDYDQIHSNYEIQQNDLALTIVGTIGKVALVECIKHKFTFQRSVGLFRSNPSILDPVYGYHYFASHQFQQALERSKNASAQGGVYLGELAKIKISYPKELPIQDKIAHILSTCDAVIEKTQAAIAKYKAIKQGMLHDLFTRGIDVKTGKLRPKYEDAPEWYKESKLGMVPREWDVAHLEDSAIEIIDGDRGVNYPKEQDFSETGYCLFLSAMNVSKDGFKFTTKQFVNKEKDESLGTGKLKKEDIVVTTRGTVGNVVFYGNEVPYENVRINSGMIILRNGSSQIKNSFLYHFIKEYLFEVYYKNAMSGSAQPQLPIKDFKKFPVVYPSSIEQDLITERLNSIDKKLLTEQTYLHKLQSIKQGLMADLLSGKKRVTVPEEEVTKSES